MASTSPPCYTNLDLIKRCDSYPYEFSSVPPSGRPIPLFYTSPTTCLSHTIGYLTPQVLTALTAVPESIRGHLHTHKSPATGYPTAVYAFSQDCESLRSGAVAAVLNYWRARKTFRSLEGWRNELYPVYDAEGKEIIMKVERAGSGLLGICNAGVHVTGFVRDDAASHGLKIWVARRAFSKPTYPGMLDNMVGGGLSVGCTVMECLLKECEEEAGLSREFVRARAKFGGDIAYWHVSGNGSGGEQGLYQQERECTFEIEMPTDVMPKPNDGEVGGFELWSVEKVQESMAKGQWKYNCSVTTLSFFIRHGIVTRENERDYDEIVRRLRREMDLPYDLRGWKY